MGLGSDRRESPKWNSSQDCSAAVQFNNSREAGPCVRASQWVDEAEDTFCVLALVKDTGIAWFSSSPPPTRDLPALARLPTGIL